MLRFEYDWIWPAVIFIGYAAAAAAFAWAIRHFWLACWPDSRLRWKPDVSDGWGFRRRSVFLDKLLLPRSSDKIGQYAQLLLEAGIPVSALAYLMARRVVGIVSVLVFAVSIVFLMLEWAGVPLVMLWTVCGSLALGVMSDRMWIGSFARRRSGQITEEMYAICRQLLYYSGSRMNLHARLRRCTPFAKRMRKAWVMLIHEWYEDPGEALLRFRLRVGTEDAHGFAETINTLRHNEYGGYYELLHRRIQDYKEKMELARESRKETFSYLLFVIAGLPILNTFRVFVYPWMEAGKRMFESLQ